LSQCQAGVNALDAVAEKVSDKLIRASQLLGLRFASGVAVREAPAQVLAHRHPHSQAEPNFPTVSRFSRRSGHSIY
jgi:hypothetical protein